MKISLTRTEARVLGVLLEKAATTPDQYPLSLNAVTTGCNQKSNRDPVTNIDQTENIAALDGLVRKHLIRERSDAGSRVAKYAHRLSGSLGLTYDFKDEELAVLCVLLLRGAQTVGEIRVRTGRLHAFDGLSAVEKVLDRLTAHADGTYVRRLERESGRKEARFMQLLCEEDAVSTGAGAATGIVDADAVRRDLSPRDCEPVADERLERLEQEVAELKRELRELKEQLGA